MDVLGIGADLPKEEFGLNFNSTDQLLALLVDVDILFVYKFWKLFKKFDCLLCIILFVFVFFCAPRRAFMNF